MVITRLGDDVKLTGGLVTTEPASARTTNAAACGVRELQ